MYKIILTFTSGHNYGELIAEVPATCTADGTAAHYECSKCHKLFVKDGDKYVEKTEADLKIASGINGKIKMYKKRKIKMYNFS